jgi:hypothetical protein
VRLDACFTQPFEQANAVNGAGGAGDADDEAQGVVSSPQSTVFGLRRV